MNFVTVRYYEKQFIEVFIRRVHLSYDVISLILILKWSEVITIIVWRYIINIVWRYIININIKVIRSQLSYDVISLILILKWSEVITIIVWRYIININIKVIRSHYNYR